MRRPLISVILLLMFISFSAYSGESGKIAAVRRISGEKLRELSGGEKPWPEELFPLSYWSAEERKKLPSAYWKKLEAREREWPAYIKKQSRLFQKEYGPACSNLYDLFIKEKIEQRRRGYSSIKPPVKEKKSLRRLVDVAYVKANYFKKIAGRPADKIRIFSYRQDGLRVIPFDILEFTKADRVVLPSGPEGNPEDGDKIFSGNDKLFFMIADAGHRVDRVFIRGKYPGAKEIQELEISCPKTGEKGWIYAVLFDEKIPAISPFDYIEFHPDHNIFYTPFCYNQCEPRKMDDKILPTLKLSTWLSAPSIGAVPYDLHERLRIRITLKYILGSTYDNEDELNVTWRAWYQGRVIDYNRAVWEVSTPLGIGAPLVFDDVVASSFSVYNYINWRTPFDPSIIMKYLDVLVGEELNERAVLHKDILRVRYITERDRKGYDADGTMSEREKSRDNGYCSWHLYTCFANTVCMRTDYDDFMKRHSKMTLEWQDDKKNTGNYDNHLIMENFKRRNHHFFVEWNAVPFFWNDDPRRYNWKSLDTVLMRLDKPVVYRIDEGERINPGAIVHIPDIKRVGDEYEH